MVYLATFDENSRILRVKIMDTSSLAGAGKTGLTYASTGLVISTIASSEATPTYYSTAAGTIEAVSVLGTYATPTATKCRFSEVSTTYHPGLYEIQLDDSRLSVAGSKYLVLSVFGVSGTNQVDTVINTTVFDLQSSTVTAGSVTDKTGYALTVTPPTAADIDTMLTTNHGTGYWNQVGDAPTVAEIDAQLSSTHGTGLWALNGTGAIEWLYYVTDSITSLPLEDVAVKVTSDIAGTVIVASASTDGEGVALFYLDAGTYYMWCYKVGYTFTNPDTEVVS